MKTQLQFRWRSGRGRVAFTMIEIALSIAIVAFAMVAIMGVLPTGLTVQRDNREDTTISQDGPFFIDAIRNGATNLAFLSNNLVWMEVSTNNVLAGRFTNLDSRQIIGFLSYPREALGTTNTVQARFVANSGSQAEKASTTRDLAFSYLLTSEVVPFTNFYNPSPNLHTANLTTNLYELQVTLRWPVLGVPPNDTNYGFGKQVFRTLVSGNLRLDTNGGTYYFFEPSSFVPTY